MQKQQNIESVLDKACIELEKENDVSDVPVSQEWMSRLFNLAQDIKDEDMQKLWRKMLAGEVKKPGTYSYRTMIALNTFTHKEVKLINKAFKYVINLHNRNILVDNNLDVRINGLDIFEKETLKNIGILSTEGLTRTYKLPEENKQIVAINTNFVCILEETIETEQIKVTFNNLTDVGNELYSLVDNNSDELLRLFAKSIKNKNGKLAVSLHKIHSIKGDILRYEDEDIILK